MYVHEQFKCTQTEIIIEQTSGWEYLCVEISNNRQPPTKHVLCNIYRKPSDLRDEFELFATQFSSLVTNIKNIKRTSHICGDFNIDLLKIKEKKHYNDNFDDIISHGFFPKITLATRISGHSCTLIDNIFSNNIELRDTSGILMNQLSDHQMVFTNIENIAKINKVLKYIEVEKSDEISLQNFINELKLLNIYDQLETKLYTNPETNYDIFTMLLKFVKNKHIPKKTVKYNKHLHMKSKWMTNGLLRSIKMKDKLYKTLLQTTVNTDLFIALKTEFKFYQKVLRRSIREAKYLYYTKTFALYKGDMKRTWSFIKDTLQRKTKCEPPCSFIHDGRIINNPNEIAKKITYISLV